MPNQYKPLRITSPLSCPNIGLSICPGKIDPWAYSGPCKRNLARDLLTIKNWGAKRIISLLEKSELEYLHVSRLGLAVRKLGLIWHHWEIIDGTALRTRKNLCGDIWQKDCETFLGDLKNGEKIFIHCRGGLGRTGTLCARLLIEQGLEPEDAIKETRIARPGAIETEEQEVYLRQKRWQNW